MRDGKLKSDVKFDVCDFELGNRGVKISDQGVGLLINYFFLFIVFDFLFVVKGFFLF